MGYIRPPHIISNIEDLRRIIGLPENPSHVLTLCSGSLGANPKNGIPTIVRELAPRIAFVHIRNVRIFDNEDFFELYRDLYNETHLWQGVAQKWRPNHKHLIYEHLFGDDKGSCLQCGKGCCE